MKKGQAAMEFLMTYGWAILVVLAAIAALVAFGVLDLDIMPDACYNFPTGTNCVGKPVVRTNTVNFVVSNNVGGDITIQGVTLAQGGCTGVEAAVGTGNFQALPVVVPNNQYVRFNVTGCNMVADTRFESEVSISYTDQYNNEIPIKGKIKGRVV